MVVCTKLYMGSENDSGGSGGHSGHGRLRPKEPENFAASDTSNGKIRHSSTESDLANGSSELVRKKRCRENDNLQKGSPDNKEDEPETLQDEAILSKAMEDEIQQLRQRVDYFTHQVLGLLETGTAYFLDASTAFEEEILQLHQKILETWEAEIEGLQNVDMVNEEICTRLREARIVLEKLQVAASTVRRLRGTVLSNC